MPQFSSRVFLAVGMMLAAGFVGLEVHAEEKPADSTAAAKAATAKVQGAGGTMERRRSTAAGFDRVRGLASRLVVEV